MSNPTFGSVRVSSLFPSWDGAVSLDVSTALASTASTTVTIDDMGMPFDGNLIVTSFVDLSVASGAEQEVYIDYVGSSPAADSSTGSTTTFRAPEVSAGYIRTRVAAVATWTGLSYLDEALLKIRVQNGSGAPDITVHHIWSCIRATLNMDLAYSGV